MRARNLWMPLVVVAICGCGEKKEVREVAPVNVKTTTVGTSAVRGGQDYSGTIEEESGTSLSFASVGTVQSINVSEGQFVQKGQLIGVLDATAARNAYEAALATKEQALDAQERMKLLHDNGSLPDIKWIEVQTQVRQALASEQIAKKGLTDTRLYAPFSGYIAQKSVEAGANVALGIAVVKLVRIEQVKVKIAVPEEEIARIQKGQTLTVTVAALGGQSYEARVTEKGVSADPLSRSYEVKGIISNPRHELLPGMVAEVRLSGYEVASLSGQEVKDVTSPQNLKTSKPQNLLTLPADILQIDADNQPFVWTVVDGKARKTAVTPGENAGDLVTIVSGLRPGDVVITEGQQKVSEGMKVKNEE